MPPRLTFFCELDPVPLKRLFETAEVVDQLKKLEAAVALAMRDFSDERVEVVQLLNRAGVPVTAWLLLPEEQGYWFNLDNADLAARRYVEFMEWSRRNNLKWQRIGLDIEPDFHWVTAFRNGILHGFRYLYKGMRKRSRILAKAKQTYRQLVERIHADGFEVEAYQLPFILEERKVRSTVLQRWLGILDLEVDREILMLYSSFNRPWGDAALLSYGKDAEWIAIGSTGGGVNLEGVADTRPLDWQEFSRDLLIAGLLKSEVAVFSLEGCVQQGFLERLVTFDWRQSVQVNEMKYRQFEQLRRLLAAGLWVFERPWLPAAVLLLLVLLGIRRKRDSK
ncbi:MAG: hypothetical protein AB1522_00035 [Chloroflexota bacterium]